MSGFASNGGQYATQSQFNGQNHSYQQQTVNQQQFYGQHQPTGEKNDQNKNKISIEFLCL